MEEQYQYRDRIVVKNPDKEFRLGEGRVSGYLSATLGILSLLAVFAYLYPSLLTTTELRQLYDAEKLQIVLKYAMYASLVLGALTLFKNNGRYKFHGLTGICFTLVAFSLGVFSWRVLHPGWPG